jgi:hypothetical protein
MQAPPLRQPSQWNPAAPITPTPPTDTSRLTVVTPLSSSAGNVPAGTELASAAPATSVTPSAPIIALIPEQKGLFLQLAAFGSQDKRADNFLLRLRTQYRLAGVNAARI